MKVLDSIFAARPLLHIPIWTIYLVSLHYNHLRYGGHFQSYDLLMLFCLSLMGAGAFYLNQVYDYNSDMVNKKLGFIQRGYVTRNQLIAGFVWMSVLGTIISLIFSFIYFLVFVQGFFLAFAYSAPSMRLKDKPFLGLFANSWSFGVLVSFCSVANLEVKNGWSSLWVFPVYFFCAVTATTALTTIPDREGDRQTGKKTIAVEKGVLGALIIAVMFLVASAGVAWFGGYGPLVALSSVSLLFTLVGLISASNSVLLFAAKAPILLLTLFAGYFYPPYILFIFVLVVVTRIYYKKRFNMVYPSLT